jgi:hypothetical protein
MPVERPLVQLKPRRRNQTPKRSSTETRIRSCRRSPRGRAGALTCREFGAVGHNPRSPECHSACPSASDPYRLASDGSPPPLHGQGAVTAASLLLPTMQEREGSRSRASRRLVLVRGRGELGVEAPALECSGSSPSASRDARARSSSLALVARSTCETLASRRGGRY